MHFSREFHSEDAQLVEVETDKHFEWPNQFSIPAYNWGEGQGRDTLPSPMSLSPGLLNTLPSAPVVSKSTGSNDNQEGFYSSALVFSRPITSAG